MVSDEPIQLEFSGLGHFGSNVVFVKVRDGPAKDKLHEIAGTSEMDSTCLCFILLMGQ